MKNTLRRGLQGAAFGMRRAKSKAVANWYRGTRPLLARIPKQARRIPLHKIEDPRLRDAASNGLFTVERAGTRLTRTKAAAALLASDTRTNRVFLVAPSGFRPAAGDGQIVNEHVDARTGLSFLEVQVTPDKIASVRPLTNGYEMDQNHHPQQIRESKNGGRVAVKLEGMPARAPGPLLSDAGALIAMVNDRNRRISSKTLRKAIARAHDKGVSRSLGDAALQSLSTPRQKAGLSSRFVEVNNRLRRSLRKRGREDLARGMDATVQLVGLSAKNAFTSSGAFVEIDPRSKTAIFLTARHGTNHDELYLYLGDQLIPARKIASDGVHDAALLEVDLSGLRTSQIKRLETVSLRKELPAAGDTIYSVGYPGLADLPRGEQRIAMVPNAKRAQADTRYMSRGAVEAVEPHLWNGTQLLVHTAATYSGQSGGPIFDQRGQVVGIVSAGAAPRATFKNFGGQVQGSMAASAHFVEPLSRKLRARARDGTLSPAGHQFLERYSQP